MSSKRKIVARKSDRKARQAHRAKKRARVDTNETGTGPTKQIDRRATVTNIEDEDDTETEHSMVEISEDEAEDAEQEHGE